FFSSRRRHTRSKRDWSSDVCSSDLGFAKLGAVAAHEKAVRAAVEVGLSAPSGYYMERNAPVQRVVDSSVVVVLAELLDAGSVGRSEERRVGKEGGARGWPAA